MTLSVAQLPPPDQQQPVVWLNWDEYLRWLSGRLTHKQTSWGEDVKLGPAWQPGEHMALDGPTGEGKTTHAVGVLGTRKYVFALDPKGEDETLSQSGFLRVRSIWQDSLRWRITHQEDAKTWAHVHKLIDDKRPAKVIVGGGSNTDEEDIALERLMREAITYARHAGGW